MGWRRGRRRDGGMYRYPSQYVDHPQSWHICLQMKTENFETRDLKWAPDGKGIVLLGRDQFCCAFEVEEM